MKGLINSLKPWLAYFLTFIFVHLLFLWSGTFLRSPEASLLGDSWILHSMANNYLEHGVMRYNGEGATLFQMPFYPWLISFFYEFVGKDSRFVLIFQILCNACLLATLLVFSKEMLGQWNKLLFVFLLFDIHILLYTSCLLTEFWVCCFWLLSWFCVGAYSHSDKNKFWYAHIFFLALAAWTKPLMCYWFPFSIIASLIIFPKTRFKWKMLSAGVVIYCLLMTPLFVRNYNITGEVGRYCTISSYNAWFFNIVYYESKKQNISIQEARYQKVNEMRIYLNEKNNTEIPLIPKHIASDRRAHVVALGLNEYSYAKTADKLVAKYMKNNFIGYVKTHLLSSVNIFSITNLSWVKLYYNRFEAFSFNKISLSELVDIITEFDFKTYLLGIRVYETITVFTLLCLSLTYLCLSPTIWLKDYFTQYGLLFIIYVTFLCGINVWGRFRYLFMPVLIYLGVQGVKSVYEKYFVKP